MKITINCDEQTGKVDLQKDNKNIPMLTVAQILSSLVTNILVNIKMAPPSKILMPKKDIIKAK